MTIFTIAFVLACVASTGQGRRLQKVGDSYEELAELRPLADLKESQLDERVRSPNMLKALATLLLGSNSAATESERPEVMTRNPQAFTREVMNLLHPHVSFDLDVEDAEIAEQGRPTSADDWRQVATTIATLQQVHSAADLHIVSERMLQEAESGDPLAMAALGTMFLFGQECEPKQNLTWGMHWLTRAAELGQKDALALMGFLHESDALYLVYGYTGFEADKSKGTQLLERAAAGGSLYASMSMGYRNAHGVGMSKNYEAAALHYEQAARLAVEGLDKVRMLSVEAANPIDYDHLTLLAHSMPIRDRMYPSDVEYMDFCAYIGDPQGMLQMGNFYHTGLHGVVRNLKAAFHWFRAAALRGEPQGHASVGMMLLRQGEYTTAVQAFRRAAKRNDMAGWAGLGYAYFYGTGLPQSDKMAANSFWLAAKQGHLDSIHNLGVLALQGRGMPQSLPLALQYFSTAAEFGHAQSQFHYGLLAKRGLGMSQDSATAQFFFKHATESGPLVKAMLGTALRAYDAGRPQRALMHYLLAAHAGVQVGQYNAGFIFANVNPPMRTVREEVAKGRAMAYFKLAAVQGSMDAQVQLANLLAERQDYQLAVQLYKDAAIAGNLPALWHLGYHYLHGRGLEQNHAKAWALFQSSGMFSSLAKLHGLEAIGFWIAKFIFQNRAPLTFAAMVITMFANGLNPAEIFAGLMQGGSSAAEHEVWMGVGDFGQGSDF